MIQTDYLSCGKRFSSDSQSLIGASDSKEEEVGDVVAAQFKCFFDLRSRFLSFDEDLTRFEFSFWCSSHRRLVLFGCSKLIEITVYLHFSRCSYWFWPKYC